MQLKRIASVLLFVAQIMATAATHNRPHVSSDFDFDAEAHLTVSKLLRR